MTTPDIQARASRKQTVMNWTLGLSTIIGAVIVALAAIVVTVFTARRPRGWVTPVIAWALLIIAFVILAVTFRG
jgi:ABC-type spermidine/putrescine transport system permease subunit II